MAEVAALRAIVGEDHVREARDEDAIDGVRPALVAMPGSIEEVSGTMELATRAGWRVAPRGCGSGVGLGNPPAALDLVLDLRRLDAILEHAAGDLVVAVEAGVPLADLQRTVGSAGQMLALDPPEPAGTGGGVIATNAAG
ncbi:MAG TPA: FAD-binding protein, partial [Longimicrobiaceae bacterium]|nr:FAD-binding protein [Longimicrobiaceae bacterium]